MQTKQLQTYIIEPALSLLSHLSSRYKAFNSKQAVKLLLMTAAVESDMGRYVIQNNSKLSEEKKALGIYQIERATIDYVFTRPDSMLKRALESFVPSYTDRYIGVIYDLFYSTVLTRAIYWYKTDKPLPSAEDNDGLWQYYKKYYNSALGGTEKEEFFKACKKHKLL